MGIAGPYGIGASTAVNRPRGPARGQNTAGFTVGEAGAEPIGGSVQVGIASLLGMQEAGQDAGRDRDARQHGESLLDALTQLQRALLGGDDTQGLMNLVAVLRRAPAAADPRLAAVQRAVLLRAAVELARRGIAASA